MATTAMRPLASRRATGAAVTALLASASVLAMSSSPAALAMSTSSATGPTTVPAALSKHDFLHTALKPITIGTDAVSSLPVASVGDKVTAKDVLASQIANAGGAGAVAFVVRRPGWGLCREEAKELDSLATKYADTVAKDFAFFGIVKEVGVDDEGLADFSSKYYPGRDLFLDDALDFYNLLGNGTVRKLSLLRTFLSPIKLYRSIKDIGRRHTEKGIEQNMIGEGLVQGGVIVFDADARPRYVYQEKTGDELPHQDILAALKEVKGMQGERVGDSKEL